MAEYTHIKGRDFGNIRMYTLSTCIWCKKTKAFMREHDVDFSYIDVDLLPPGEQETIREEQLWYNPSGSYPTIVIDSDYCIVGFDEPKLRRLIGE